MAINPFTREKLVVETLIEFVRYDENGVVVLEDGVSIKRCEGYFEFYEDHEIIAKVKDKVTINPENYYTSKMLTQEKAELCEVLKEHQEHEMCKHSHQSKSSSNMVQAPSISHPSLNNPSLPFGFIPPYFGVTVLGSSHGFDTVGSTSGYILWINQRGIMVDPPPFSR